jgi:hypothetical protein
MNQCVRNSADGDAHPSFAERDIVEIPLLLPSWQVEALAAAAQDRGMTVGEMMRRLLHDFIRNREQQQSLAVH